MPDVPPMQDAGPLWLHEATVRPDWVDYNGHMSEAYYVLIFGDATDAFYDHVGMDDMFRRQHNVSIYTLEAHIRYLIEAHQGQHLRVGTRLLRHDARRMRLHHTMLGEGGQPLAVTELSAMHVDKAALRGVPFLAAPLARLAAIAAAQADLPAAQAAVSAHW